MASWTSKIGVVALAGALAVGLSASRRTNTAAASRNLAVERALAPRGLVVDPDGVLFLHEPPSALAAVASTVPVVIRARPSAEEPHDIFVASARLSPEGVLLDVGPTFNLTETAAVDELAPVGDGDRFAFAEQGLLDPEAAPSRVRLVDLGGAPSSGRSRWGRLERVQGAITRLQSTGRLDGVARVAYTLEPPPETMSVAMADGHLRITADDREAVIDPAEPLAVPRWLGVEATPERRPGNVVTWAVDRVRSVVGDEAMQYVKAIAFTALDVVLSGKEDLTSDTGAEDIAADLGQDSLAAEEIDRQIPVDPQIGFPPPPLEPWVEPSLPGEGQWNAKGDNPFIHQLPGLPPTFITTFIRSDQRRKATRVYIALWDPRLVQLNMMAGVAEPKSATGATGPGLIPREPKVLKRVAAAMNAGFQALHGEYGMMADGVVYLPPKPYGATVATMRDGSTAFGTWPLDPAVPEGMLSYRQNMTPIVVNKEFNPYGRTWWGGTPPGWEDKTHTTRTGICTTEEGFVGYFYGADLSPNALARAMIQARCDYGIALDMNAGHSGLEFYRVGPADGFAELERPLRRDWEREGEVPGLDGWKFRARRLIRGMGLMNFPRYIKREGRDFFYLTMRYVLPGPPLAGGADEGAWTVKGLPQHGFPYALARAEMTLPSGAKATVLKVDPRMLTTLEEQATVEDGAGAEAAKSVVAQVQPHAFAEGLTSLWHTPDAFSVADAPAVAPAERVTSGPPLGADDVRAGIGVQEEEGMLVYVEAERAVAGKELAAVLESLGAGEEAIGLIEPLPWALNGDTDLGGEAVRLPSDRPITTFYRKPAAGVRRIFPDTPVVPLKEWHPLQARRIRYFKKPKKKKKDT